MTIVLIIIYVQIKSISFDSLKFKYSVLDSVLDSVLNTILN